MSKKQILVPTDFTSVARCAENHAVKTAEIVNGKVHLLHVVKNKDDIKDAKSKLENEVKELHENTSINIDSTVRIGSIFEDIGDVASEIEADLIFMGTHGMKGIQFLKGSNALRVIKSSPAPFIVVQEKPINEEGYDDIVVPLDLTKQTKQKLDITLNIAKYFKSRIHLITPKESDEFLKNQLDRNLSFAKQFLKENNIDFTTTISEEKGGNFARTIVKHASAKNADLITIMNMQENSLMGMLGSSYEQQLITNDAEIPVMVVNPLETTVPESILFT